MRCKVCGAYLTIGGERTDPIGDRTEIEAMAWAKGDYVRCWRCGYGYKPTHKPSDRQNLQWGSHALDYKKPLSLQTFYRRRKEPWEAYRTKVKGRKIA